MQVNLGPSLLLPVVFFSIVSLDLRAQNTTEGNVALNRAAYQSSAINYDNVAHLATDGSDETFWQSKAEAQPWLYVDLGTVLKITGVKLNWGKLAPTGCKIQVSAQGALPTSWTDLVPLRCTAGKSAEVTFPKVEVRYVRMLADEGSAPGGCQLKEFSVIGEKPADAPLMVVPPLPQPDQQNKISLDGAGWHLQNTLFLAESGEAISQPSFVEKSWIPAKVPGTVLNSYLLAGAIPDPNYSNQQELISESFFQQDFWYRREFIPPVIGPGQHFLLNCEGINWKADLYLNGSQVGHIDGAFARGKFDLTEKLLPGQKNALAVLIHKCANPGPTNFKLLNKSSHNGGILGKDNPTFCASLGWNWMPSIRGRDIGIWDHIYLEQTGPIVLIDPFVRSAVSSDHHQAELTVQVTLQNMDSNTVSTKLTGKLSDVTFSQPISLAPHESKTVTWDKATFPQLRLSEPKLWWPNGYGEQPLQNLTLSVDANGTPSSTKEITFGIRELTYDTSNHVLKLLCNGQPIQLNGGNWGMDETMLRYEAKDYDTAIRLHKEMNMDMIRNWVGQIGKEEFFEACDKYGILVWNDFWLANPSDGPNPDDHKMFMDNVHDRILRIRNHASLALYCGRNEGNPPADLDAGMAKETTSLDGSRFYIPNSASGLVTGHGPYEPRPQSWYFKVGETQEKEGSNRGGIGTTLHSELGIVCVPTADTMRLMMSEKDLWPISDLWAVHDYYQPRCHTYTAKVNEGYGVSQNVDEFCEKAQMENWENAKAMFEAWRSESGSGCLAWMSHPAWPSLICQFYDYYLNPTGAYFGAKIANEPLHILWDAFSNKIKVANNTGQSFSDLHAEAWIYNLDGTLKNHQESPVQSPAGSPAVDCFELSYPADLSDVHFIKLVLSSKEKVVSENFYWRGLKEDSYQSLNGMTPVKLNSSFALTQSEGRTHLTVSFENPSDQIALMVCVKVVKAQQPTQRILPIFYSDNYVSLRPHEKRSIQAEFETGQLAGDQPNVIVNGWNVPSVVLPAGSTP